MTTALPARGDSVQTWATPWHIVRAVEIDSFEGERFALDACAHETTAKAHAWWAIESGGNGLRDVWTDRTWCNPPYENQDEWLARGVYEAQEHGLRSAHLVLASTSSRYWRPLTFEQGEVEFYEGRIAFLDDTGAARPGASFSSALVKYGPGFRPGVVRVRSAETGKIIGRDMRVMELFS